MNAYYAHTLPDKPLSEWQSLEAHLENVAKLAFEFGKVFDSGEVCRLLGRLHDVGKFSNEFQLYLSKHKDGEV